MIEHHYPHGHVRLHFFDCVPADPAAEPAAGSGCRWVPAAELRALCASRRPTSRSWRSWPAAVIARRCSGDVSPASHGPARSDPLGIDRERRSAIDDVVDQAVLAGLFGAHEAVAVGVFLELLERLAGVPLVDLR